MKKVKILFSKSKYPKLNKFGEKSEKFFKSRIKFGDFKTEAGGIIENFDRKNNYSLLVHGGTGEMDFNDLQNLGARGLRKAVSFQGESDLQVNLLFENSFSREERKFIEKGVLMAEMKDDWFKTKENNNNKEDEKEKIGHSKEIESKNKEEENCKKGSYKTGEEGNSEQKGDGKNKFKTEIKGIITKNIRKLVESIDIAREIQSKPSNVMNPVGLENFIKDNLDKKSKKGKNMGLKITYHQQDFLEKEKMGLFLAVNQGSKDRAKMVQMEFNGGAEGEEPIVLIGKGLTYDSGGYYMKPYPQMNEMGGDMGGASTVIGIMSGLKVLGIKKNVIGIVGVTENMVDANSYKNGDILTAKNGKTVYVGHTDAEGRLVLADMLSYADSTFNPKMIFDFATLTGSCHHSLGEMYTGIFSDNKKLLDKLGKIGEETNDLTWQLPFDKRIKDSVKHEQADISNTGKFTFMGAGGAAAFLSFFVKDTKKWVHCDVAGTGLRSAQKQDYDLPCSFGTGSMISLMFDYLK